MVIPIFKLIESSPTHNTTCAFVFWPQPFLHSPSDLRFAYAAMLRSFAAGFVHRDRTKASAGPGALQIREIEIFRRAGQWRFQLARLGQVFNDRLESRLFYLQAV